MKSLNSKELFIQDLKRSRIFLHLNSFLDFILFHLFMFSEQFPFDHLRFQLSSFLHLLFTSSYLCLFNLNIMSFFDNRLPFLRVTLPALVNVLVLLNHVLLMPFLLCFLLLFDSFQDKVKRLLVKRIAHQKFEFDQQIHLFLRICCFTNTFQL